MKRSLFVLVVAFASLVACNKSHVPQYEEAQIRSVVDARQYIFKAQTANPMGGTSITLTTAYDLIVRQNTVVAALPYFGRAYTPMNMGGGGITFTSERFQYASSPTDKGGWEIAIVPEDVPDIRELRLSVGADGYGTLHVTSNSKQAISFYGTLQPIKK